MFKPESVKSNDLKQIGVRVTIEVKEQLDRLVKTSNITMNDLINQMIKYALNTLEKADKPSESEKK